METKNNMKHFFCIAFTYMMVFCQMFAQEAENRYIKESLKTSNIINYKHRLSHEKDKSQLLNRLPGWKLEVIANHMSDAMNKQQYHKQFIANLQKEFTKEELLRLSSFTGVISFKLDVYNELYDICFIIDEDCDIVLSDNEYDRIITCLEAIDDIVFDLEYLQEIAEIGISMNNRPFISYTWGGKLWKRLQ